MRFLSLLLMMGCSEVRVVIGHEVTGCTDYDPDDPPEEVLDYAMEDLLVSVFREGVIESCDVDFEPDIELDGKVIVIREYWSETEDAGCTTCFVPTILLKDPDPGEYDLNWYLGEDRIPFDNVQFEVE
jgi:hypothetical protein